MPFVRMQAFSLWQSVSSFGLTTSGRCLTHSRLSPCEDGADWLIAFRRHKHGQA